jgi:hypothetical protein
LKFTRTIRTAELQEPFLLVGGYLLLASSASGRKLCLGKFLANKHRRLAIILAEGVCD